MLVVFIRASLGKRARRNKLPGSPDTASAVVQLSDPKALEEKQFGLLNDSEALRSFSLQDGKRILPRRIVGSVTPRKLRGTDEKAVAESATITNKIKALIFFSSITGSTQKTAEDFILELGTSLSKIENGTTVHLVPELHDLSYIDYDDFFISPPRDDAGTGTRNFYLFLIPTYNIDTIMNNFLVHLQETHHDFRINTAPLSSIAGYSVFGFGDREGWPTEEVGFCSQAKEVDRWMAKLTGRKRAFPLGMGDVKSDASRRLEEWRIGLVDILKDISSKGGLGEGVTGSGDPVESEEEDSDDEALSDDTARTTPRRKQARKGDAQKVDDLEDLGRQVAASAKALTKKSTTGSSGPSPLPVDFTIYGKSPSGSSGPSALEMVPKESPTYAALTKQGYTIVGSHSGVKICRWTKSALRGRGSCYKYSFYGIKSHQCMETTPSLSCSNKCVFCWRHGTNPVGTTWRWKVDPPGLIFAGVKEGHYKKIKMLKGVPGVRAERFQEAMHIRHCALSLVGEPIFYPHINEFTSMLHKEHISSFLVCNAQHPAQLRALNHVTQLYVSIDASNRDSLRKIDRPLHRDFWERFQECLDIIRENQFRQRTVFRLTLVKGFNIEDEVEGYATLVERGLPCFVEIKGVTFCGTSTSKGVGLNMGNVPFYDEVVAFVVALNEALAKRGLSYGIAAEHAHRYVNTNWGLLLMHPLTLSGQLLCLDCVEEILYQREMAHHHRLRPLLRAPRVRKRVFSRGLRRPANP